MELIWGNGFQIHLPKSRNHNAKITPLPLICWIRVNLLISTRNYLSRFSSDLGKLLLAPNIDGQLASDYDPLPENWQMAQIRFDFRTTHYLGKMARIPVVW